MDRKLWFFTVAWSLGFPIPGVRDYPQSPKGSDFGVAERSSGTQPAAAGAQQMLLPVPRQVCPVPGLQKGHSCWGLGTWLRSTRSLAPPLWTSLTSTNEKAGATHPVIVVTHRGLPQTWWHRAVAGGEAELAWDKGTWAVHAWGKGQVGSRWKAPLSWVSKSQAPSLSEPEALRPTGCCQQPAPPAGGSCKC